jgi:hypothetical protein
MPCQTFLTKKKKLLATLAFSIQHLTVGVGSGRAVRVLDKSVVRP